MPRRGGTPKRIRLLGLVAVSLACMVASCGQPGAAPGEPPAPSLSLAPSSLPHAPPELRRINTLMENELADVHGGVTVPEDGRVLVRVKKGHEAEVQRELASRGFDHVTSIVSVENSYAELKGLTLAIARDPALPENVTGWGPDVLANKVEVWLSASADRAAVTTWFAEKYGSSLVTISANTKEPPTPGAAGRQN